MSYLLFLQSETARWSLVDLREFVGTFWPVLVPGVLGFLAIYLLLPRAQRFRPLVGGGLAAVALVSAVWLWIRKDPHAPRTEVVLFYAFSGLAIVSGALLIIQKNPVRAALCFAMVVLSTCGLFLLQAAPFLMAATIIIYAGAIVVTFLFVIMLAQQAGISDADQRSREPFLASLAGFVLLGALVCVLMSTYDPESMSARSKTAQELGAELQRLAEAEESGELEQMRQLLGEERAFFKRLKKLAPPSQDSKTKLAIYWELFQRDIDHADPICSNHNSRVADVREELRKVHRSGTRVWYFLHGTLQPSDSLRKSSFSGRLPSADFPREADGAVREGLPAANVAALGRSLFSDYLFAVILAGVLLLVATLGAIAIAARRPEGLR